MLAVPVALGVSAALLLGGRSLHLVVGPYLQRTTTTEVTVMWETSRLSRGEVEYGRALPLDRRAPSHGLETLHEVSLSDLEPGATYLYRVVSRSEDGGEAASPVYHLATDPGPGAATSFVVVGDTQDGPEVWGRIARLAYGERPQFVVHCGDIVEVGAEKDRWVDEFFGPARGLLARVPLFAVLGNHEADSAHYYRYMSNPEPEHRYAFRFGDAEFFMLDSNRDLCAGSPQHAWLDRALGASRAPWKFAVLHHPPFTSDEDDYGDSACGPTRTGDPRVTDVIPLFERHGVDVVFFGHIHDYERSWPVREGRIDEARGTVYVQSGGGGGSLEDFAPVRSWFTAKVRRTHHYVIVSLCGQNLELQAYDATGRLFDRYARARRALPVGPSASDRSAVPAGDDDHGGARREAVSEVRPAGGGSLEGADGAARR
jgi:predicted phosphodiesterase